LRRLRKICDHSGAQPLTRTTLSATKSPGIAGAFCLRATTLHWRLTDVCGLPSGTVHPVIGHHDLLPRAPAVRAGFQKNVPELQDCVQPARCRNRQLLHLRVAEGSTGIVIVFYRAVPDRHGHQNVGLQARRERVFISRFGGKCYESHRTERFCCHRIPDNGIDDLVGKPDCSQNTEPLLGGLVCSV
jgi:hypothetical protein